MLKKPFDKNPTPFHVKSPGDIQDTSDIIKTMYSKAIAKINLNREKLKAIPLKSGIRKGCPLFAYLFNIVFEVSATAIRQLSMTNGIQIGKQEVKVSLFEDDMIVYISDP